MNKKVDELVIGKKYVVSEDIENTVANTNIKGISEIPAVIRAGTVVELIDICGVIASVKSIHTNVKFNMSAYKLNSTTIIIEKDGIDIELTIGKKYRVIEDNNTTDELAIFKSDDAVELISVHDNIATVKPTGLKCYEQVPVYRLTKYHTYDSVNVFKKELVELCKRHDVTVFAGYCGVRFDFHNGDDIDVMDGYYNQHFKTKELVKSE